MLLVIAEDITEQKAAERSLARARNELARVARASSLGELAASIAHEVNQPLAAVVTNGHAGLRWLDASPPDGNEARLALQRIIRDANRAGEVITRIRNFLRRGEPVRQPVRFHAVVQDVLALVRSEAQSQHVVLREQVDAGLPPVLGDAVQLQQVILNLVMNAIESIARSGAGQGTVALTARREGEEMLRVDVRDSGTGIEPSAMTRIFEAFYTSKPEGMGMGLAIAHSIVEAHGGRLWVSLNADAGATFHFTLPLAMPQALSPQATP
jgi:signal transduction histidine kinase